MLSYRFSALTHVGRVALAALFTTTAPLGCDPDELEGREDELALDDEDDAALAEKNSGPVEEEFHAPSKPPRAEVDELAAAEPEATAAQLMYTYTWLQGQAAVPMGGVDDRFCFLTEVAGDFAGSGERVHVYQSGGSWWLGGYSQQTGLRASALCIPKVYWGQTLNYTGEYSWVQGSNAKYMGAESGRICFLVRVEGKYAGGGERVQAYTDGGSWWLGGSSQQLGVAAGARCVNTGWIAGPYHWNQGSAPTSILSANDWACGLSRVQGKFEGAGERISAYFSGDWWYLGGSSAQTGVAGSAYCM